MKKLFSIPMLLALAAVLVASAGCAKGESARTAGTVESVSLRTPSSDYNKGQCFVSVDARGSWSLSIAENVSWARLSVSRGSDCRADIVFEWDANPSEQARELSLKLLSEEDGSAVLATFRQGGVPVSEIVPDPVPDWMELPSTDSRSLYFFTHPMTIDGKHYRNYSYYWDKENLVARWVAYPLNATLLKGGSGRSDCWGLDPKLPKKYQPVLYSAYKGFGARGHQIPSADRQQYDANVQTFYGVNMTPQDYDLNGGAWANLENYVRSCSRSVDTLYVVTGCTIDGSDDYAYDNDGKSVRVPTGYFKALLAYSSKKAVGAGTGGYIGAAFYFENRSYSGSFLNEITTISELEQLTGLDFFVNLPAAVGKDAARKIESTLDKWWK